jgi:hypothetical protein
MAFSRAHLSGPVYFGGAELPGRMWTYSHTDVGTGAAYFTNARDYGIEAGDLIISRQVNSLTAPTTFTVAFLKVTVVDPITGHGTAAAIP